MGEGRSDSGHSAEATVSFFQPARNSILILLGAAALAGPLFEFLTQGAPGLGAVECPICAPSNATARAIRKAQEEGVAVRAADTRW